MVATSYGDSSQPVWHIHRTFSLPSGIFIFILVTRIANFQPRPPLAQPYCPITLRNPAREDLWMGPHFRCLFHLRSWRVFIYHYRKDEGLRCGGFSRILRTLLCPPLIYN